MKRRVMRQEDVAEFCRYLQGEERSQGTIETYRREIRAFAATLPENRVVTKEVVVAWKETLAKRYAVSTVNGKLAALNGLFFLPGMAGVPGEASAAAAGCSGIKGTGTGQGGVSPPARCG
ncbi:MAG: site-specific integrase [Evtepia gabavorous]